MKKEEIIKKQLDVFERVKTHLLEQNERSMKEDYTSCMYRNSSGLKCAIGCLIDDEDYDPIMEGHSLDDTDSKKTRLLEDALKKADSLVDIELLVNLQTLHDEHPVEEWPEDLEYMENDIKTGYYV